MYMRTYQSNKTNTFCVPYSPHVENIAILKQLNFPLVKMFIAAPSVTFLANFTHLLQMTVNFVVVLDGKLTVLTTV